MWCDRRHSEDRPFHFKIGQNPAHFAISISDIVIIIADRSPPKASPKRRHIHSPGITTLRGSPQGYQPPRIRPRRLRRSPPLKVSIKQTVTDEEKIGKRRHSEAYLMLDGSVENMCASGEVRAIAGKCKVLKTSLTSVTDACKEHRRCEDFTVEYLCNFLRKCKELSAVFLPHINDSIRWEEVLEGEYLMDEDLEKKLWEVENEGCKFCFVEYMLGYKSLYLWLLALRHLGMEKEYRRSMARLKSMKRDVIYLQRWVDEIMTSVAGIENVA